MSRPVATFHVTPFHGQVWFGDPSEDYPQWETGEESVVWNARRVAVATSSDLEGDVTVDVWNDRQSAPSDLTTIIIVEIAVGVDGLCVGDTVSEHREQLADQPGDYRLTLLSDGAVPTRIGAVIERLALQG